jgi:Xaa-Pro dipeptidase
MLEERLVRLQAELQTRDIDCLALIPGTNLRYMSGLEFHLMERPIVGFFPAEGQPVFALPALERSRFERHVPYAAQIFGYADGDDPADAVRGAVMALPEVRCIAVEHLGMRVLELRLVQRHVPTALMVNADPVMDVLRLVKGPDEIEHLRAAIAISERALDQVIGTVRPGMTEREIANQLLIAQLELGGGPAPFEPIVQVGANAADPHGTPGEQEVRAGEVLLIDFGTTHEGYASDITRTFMVGGPPDERAREVYEAVRAANAAGREAAGPGVPCQEVDRATRAVIEAAGLGEHFIHRTGHGLGMGAHEGPSVDKSNRTPLEAGNVITIEPGVYIPGEMGVRIEDDVLITEDSAVSLTGYERDFQIIGVPEPDDD